jgi:hypothetical protein
MKNLTPYLTHPTIRTRLAHAMEQKQRNDRRARSKKREIYRLPEHEGGNGGVAFCVILLVSIALYVSGALYIIYRM